MPEMVDRPHLEHITVDDSDIRNIVLSYLIHNCYKETAEVFQSCTGMKQSVESCAAMDTRKAIIQYVLEGNCPRAMELIKELAPNLLESDKDLQFDLLCQNVIDLIRARKIHEALVFAQTHLSSFGSSPKYLGKLEEVLALFAYEVPETAPMASLLSPEYQQTVTDSVNRAVLAHANLPAFSSLERLVQQVSVVKEQLNSGNANKDDCTPFSLKVFLDS